MNTTRKLKKYKPTRFMEKTSRYDKEAADYAVMFIEGLCHTTEGNVVHYGYIEIHRVLG